jgi:hypothetical protein
LAGVDVTHQDRLLETPPGSLTFGVQYVASASTAIPIAMICNAAVMCQSALIAATSQDATAVPCATSHLRVGMSDFCV